jgi:ubiquinone/menaquinone biosynthesis C-methylase UbiE
MEDVTHEYYGARAPEYDTVYLKPERQANLREIETWLPTVFAGASLLEVACGTGYWTQFISRTATNVLAIDAASETLNIAVNRFSSNNTKYVLGDAYALPETAEFFDAGFAGFWISHVPKARLRSFLDGFHKVLTPGARVVLLDNRYVEGSSTPISERDADGNTYQVRGLADGSKHRILKNFLTHDDLRQATDGLATDLQFHEWDYFWALEYTTKLHGI